MNVQIQIVANYDGYPVNLQNDHFTKSFIHKPSNSYFRPNFSNKYIDVNRINYILTFLLLHWEFGGLINNNEIRATSSNDSQICDINLRPRKWVAIGVNLYSRGRQRAMARVRSPLIANYRPLQACSLFHRMVPRRRSLTIVRDPSVLFFVTIGILARKPTDRG